MIATTFLIQPATCSAAAAAILMHQRKQEQERAETARLLAEAQRSRDEAEAAKPKKNIELNVSIGSPGGSISSKGPVASGSSVRFRLTTEREYIVSKTYNGDVITNVGKFSATLGDEVFVTPSITGGGQVLVEVAVMHSVPDEKSASPWLDQKFSVQRNNQTFLLESGAPSVSRTIQIPGMKVGMTISLQAEIEQGS